MSISPIITFKAGICDADSEVSPPRIKPVATKGFLYLYSEDDLIHFCWRAREASLDDPEIDLIMVPQDGYFKPYLGEQKIPNTSPINGRVFVLKFRSSSERKFFWLQSREQPAGQVSTFSSRDLRLGRIVDNILQGEEVNYGEEPAGPTGQDDDDDDDDVMEDVQETDQLLGHHRTQSTGGAGSDATGGDVRNEGEDSRDGGADGGRAGGGSQSQMSDAVQNFLKSLGGNAANSSQAGSAAQNKSFTTLPDLLASSSTIAMVDEADEAFIDNLLARELPSTLIALEMEPDVSDVQELDQETADAVVMSLELEKKKSIVKKVLRSPQFAQSLMSLTGALRDGGLPMVSQSMGVEVKNGGYTGPDRRMPLEGGDAIEAFLEGAKDAANKTREEK